MVPKFVSTLLTGAVMLASGSAVFAATGPTGAASKGSSPGQLPSPGNGALTTEAIGAFLKTLDANVQMRSWQDKDKKNTYYQYALKIVRDGWTYDVRTHVAPGRIFLICDLSNTLTNLDNVHASTLQRVLETNWRIYPTAIHFSKGNDGTVQLVAEYGLDRTITVERLRSGLDEFMFYVKDSYSIWSEILDAAK
jgi:hypothetical protein